MKRDLGGSINPSDAGAAQGIDLPYPVTIYGNTVMRLVR